jgi:hypothetical protein
MTTNQKLLAAFKSDRRVQAISIEQDRIAVLAQTNIRYLRSVNSDGGTDLTAQEYADLLELNAAISAQQILLRDLMYMVESHIKVTITGTQYNDGVHPYIPKTWKMPAIQRPIWNLADEFADPVKANELNAQYNAFLSIVGYSRRNTWGFTWQLPVSAAAYLNPGTPIPGDA